MTETNTNVFNEFYQILQLEGFSLTDERIPYLFFHKNYSCFLKKFSCFLKSKSSVIKQIILVYDGVYKKSSLESDEDIIVTLINLFTQQYQVLSINASELCDINPLDIHASELFLKEIMGVIAQFSANSTVFISVGSGTITDLLKHSLFLLETHKKSLFISIPTATTVTAFTAAFSVIDLEGSKRTRPSKNVDATFWIEPLLQAAPERLSRAGYGDLLAKFMAYGDWYLGFKLGVLKNYDELALRLMEIFSKLVKDIAIDVGQNLKNSPDVIKNLSIMLSIAGISTTLAKETTPISGFEHVISHAIDYLHLISNKPLLLHGEQVALATLSSSIAYDWFLKSNFNFKKMHFLNEKEIKKLIEDLLFSAPYFSIEEQSLSKNEREKKFDLILPKIKSSIPIFYEDYLKKNDLCVEAFKNLDNFISNIDLIKNKLKTLVISPNKMLELLKLAGLPCSPEECTPILTIQEYKWALNFSPFVRTRFCLADLIYYLAEDPYNFVVH